MHLLAWGVLALLCGIAIWRTNYGMTHPEASSRDGCMTLVFLALVSYVALLLTIVFERQASP